MAPKILRGRRQSICDGLGFAKSRVVLIGFLGLWGPGFRSFMVQNGFRISGLGFRVQSLGFRVSGLGFRVSGMV